MKTIAVIFGGRSTEHDVSIVTAIASIIKPLELTGEFKVEPVYIAKDGSWFWSQQLKDIKLYQSDAIDNFLRKSPKVQLLFDDGLKLVKPGSLGKRKITKIDVVFPAMHGTYGEDGTLMGLMEMANVPYVGCDFRASTVAMDKVLAKQVAEASGIESNPWTWFFAKELVRDSKQTLQKISHLRYPLFVKPAHLGSSIAISKVDNQTELVNALEVAAHYDDKVVVEEEVKNLVEATLPIIGNDELTLALLEHPLTKPGDYFDFETKYMQGGKKGGGKKSGTKGSQGYSQIPAPLSKDLYEKTEAVGLAVYRALGCSGIARVDMLVDTKAGKAYFNEVNPLPGGLYVHNWQKAGISNVELVKKLIDYAEARWQANKRLTTSFDTSFLKQF